MTGTDPIAELTTALVAKLTANADFLGIDVVELDHEDYQKRWAASIAKAAVGVTVLVTEFDEDDSLCQVSAEFLVEVEMGGPQKANLARARSLIFSARNILRRVSPVSPWSGCAIPNVKLLSKSPIIWQLTGRTTLQLA